MKTNNPGINYGGLGSTCNQDSKTGIRYGVIPLSELSEFAFDNFEPNYGEPFCPKCKGTLVPFEDIKDSDQFIPYTQYSAKEFGCENCKVFLDGHHCFPEEPLGHTYHAEGYKLSLGSSNDVWIIKSPFFTYAQFCSPCAPGACYLGNPLDTAVEANKCYCLDPEWFEGGKAPYTVYST